MPSPLLKEIRHKPLLWLLVFVPAVFAGEKLAPDAPTLLFLLSILAIALVTLAGVTVLVALVSEVFVESVQEAAEAFGMSPAFVGP